MKFLAVLAAVLTLNFVRPVLALPEDPPADEKNPAAADEESLPPAEKTLPAELTLENFDEFTGLALSFVEFYSPYCSHCKALAPKWKEAYFLTEHEQNSAKIYMRQVNCVESGDLCEREGINFFPDLRLYVPSKAGSSGRPLRFVDSFPNSLARTPANFHKYLKTAAAEFAADTFDLPSLSEQMTVDLGLQVVAGEALEPYLVTLYSSTNEQFNRGQFPDSCLHCVKHHQAWTHLSNAVATSARTAHLNCHSHPLLCENLGYADWARLSKALLPRYIMFVPKSAGIWRFDYTGEASLLALKAFAVKLAANAKYEEVTTRGLEDLGFLKTELFSEPQDLYYPLSNKMSLVFSYDILTVTPEDRAIMPYLLETVTRLPFDISLYASHSNKIENLLEHQAKGLVLYVNSDPTFADILYDRHLHLATTLSAKPTLYIFKEHSLVPVVYQNFALERMRDSGNIENFIKKNMFPMYGELTPALFKNYFFDKCRKNNQKDKVVITFLKADDATAIKHTLFNLSMVAHQYHAQKSRFYFNDLVDARNEKGKKVAQLKADNAKTLDIIDQMRELVPHLFDNSEVLFTYVDMVQYPNFANQFGLNIDGKQYQSGDTIVVSKEQSFYWDSDFKGNQLTSNREILRHVLGYLLSPKLAPANAKLSSKLVGSPYPRFLRSVDIIHQHGFFGYVFFFLAIFLAYQVWKKVTSRRPAGDRRVGIIGTALSKSD